MQTILEQQTGGGASATGYRMSPQQTQVWQRQESAGGQTAFRAQCVWTLEGGLKTGALRAAVESVVGRHESLRTGFVKQPGTRTPLQVISERAAVDWRAADCGALDEDARRRRLAAVCEEDARAGDSEVGSAVRATLVSFGGERHTLVLTVPALCADDASLSVLFEEVAAFYGGADAEDAGEPLQYADYCEWQRELLEDEEAAQEGRAFWRAQHAGGQTPLRLPFEDAPAAEHAAGLRLHEVGVPVARELSSRLEAAASSSGVTMESLLQAAWEALLGRLGESDSFVLERASGPRVHEELEGAVGLFARVLRLTRRVEGAEMFRELARRVEAESGEAVSWQEYDGVVEASEEGAGVGFEYAERSASRVSGGVRWSVSSQRCVLAEARLWLRCEREADASLRVVLRHDPRAFSDSDAARVGEQFLAVLTSAAARPDARVEDLDVLGASERRLLFGETVVAVDDNVAGIVEAFEAHAARTPDATAVVFEGGELTFAELNGRANRLAHLLRRRGVRPDVKVALLVGRDGGTLVGLLGILKAGGAYAPLNIDAPKGQLADVLADLETPVVVTEEALLGRLPKFGGAVVCLDRDEATFAAESSDNPEPVADGANLAYVIYTSGSTGRPKGVGVTRANLLNYTRSVCRTLSLRAAEGEPALSFATVSTVAADLGNTSIFPALYTGGTLHLISYETATDSRRFARHLAERPVDVLKIVPSHLNALLSAGDEAAVLPRRRLILGGEALPPRLAARVASAAPGCAVVNHYGPTETTVGTLTLRLDENEIPAGAATVPVGRPLDNTRAYVLDRRMRPVPLGVRGELYVGGAGVARGYLNRPALTAERFVPDPFSSEPGARLYRTGDVVRCLRGGEIEFLGRADNQVKIRGFRVEPGEIEAALLKHPAVRETVVSAVEDERGHKRLVAYVVGDSAPAADELQQFLKELLPEYMIPAAFVALGELPLTPNGKVDRRALPEPQEQTAAGREFAAPRSEVERTLAEIWKQVLGLEQVGTGDNFFALGGDSIISIQIIARANQKGLRLTPKQLFQHQTIAELAAVAETSDAGTRAEQGAVSGELPLTPVQRWFFEQNLSAPHHWNQTLLLEVRQQLEAPLLARAVGQLLAHHDALRLRFKRTDAGWRQLNAAEVGDVPFTRVDLSALAAGEQSREIERLSAEAQAGLDLEAGPLVRVVLFDLGAGRPARLLFVVHHLATDGISWRVILEDLQDAYSQLARGEASPRLPAKTVSFKRWAGQLAEHARSEELKAELPFWSEQSAAQVSPLPRDRACGPNTVASARVVSAELDADETRALLREVPAVFHTQVNDVLLTALAQAFSNWTNRTSLLVELEGHGREEVVADADVSRTVGWFTTHYPVALHLEGAGGPAQAVRAVKEQLRRVPSNGIGYGLLRYLSDDAEVAERLRAGAHAEVSFNYLGQLDQSLPQGSPFAPAAESAGPSRAESDARPFLLEVVGGVSGGRLRMTWTYSENAHDRATVERLAEDFLNALRTLVALARAGEGGCHTPADFPLAGLDQQSLDRLLAGGGPVWDIYPLSPVQQGLLFHSLHSPEAGLYFEQKTCLLRGRLDAAAFRRACQAVVNRHAILLTSFAWQGLEEPLQVVRTSVEAPWAEHDLGGLDAEGREARLAEFFREDRARPFDPSVAPLMRFTLFRLDDETHRFVWSHHHLLLDGWTMPILFREVFVLYESFRRGLSAELPAPKPYRDYIAWLAEQDMGEAEAFWRRALAGVTAPTSLASGGPAARGHEPPQGDVYDRREVRLSEATTDAARAVARRHQLTLNTLVQGAWSLVLGHASRSEDVVFGATVSGRPAALEGVEQMVGLFINTLPVRVRVAPASPLVSWLRTLQERQVEMRQFEHTPLVKVQGWSDVPRELPMFENILVFDNYPVDASTIPAPDTPEDERVGAVEIENFEAFEKTNYALLVQAGVGASLELRLLYDRRLFTAETIARLASHFELLVGLIAASPESNVGALLGALAEADRQEQALAQQRRREEKLKRFGAVRPKAVELGARDEAR